MKHIMTCRVCGSFTLKKQCCDMDTVQVGPAKYRPDDPYDAYRRDAKRDVYKKRGLL